MPQTEGHTETRFQCRHIFTDGHRCGSPSLRGEEFCYYHHTTRRPIRHAEIQAGEGHRATFNLPNPEDRSAIQLAIGEVLQRIAANDIDPRRAGLLLYGLQIASLNLPKSASAAEPTPTVDEIVLDADLGLLAPVAEYTPKHEQKDEAPSAAAYRIWGLPDRQTQERARREQAESAATLSTLRAEAPRRSTPNTQLLKTLRKNRGRGRHRPNPHPKIEGMLRTQSVER
jgi:hypothetical protein